MTIVEFKEKAHEIYLKGTAYIGVFSENYYIDKNNNCSYQDGGYNVYLTYEGKHYHYGFNTNGVEEIL